MTPKTRLSLPFISLFIQYSLVISLTVLPIDNSAIIRAQEKTSRGNGPGIPSKSEAEDGDGLVRPMDDKLGLLKDQPNRLTNRGLNSASDLSQISENRIGLPRTRSLAADIMGFANAETAKDPFKPFGDESSKGESAPSENSPQDPARPNPTPPFPASEVADVDQEAALTSIRHSGARGPLTVCAHLPR